MKDKFFTWSVHTHIFAEDGGPTGEGQLLGFGITCACGKKFRLDMGAQYECRCGRKFVQVDRVITDPWVAVLGEDVA